MASTSTVKRLSAAEKYPNWLEMPNELMTNILERLDDVEILNNALKVCTTWWKICKDPAMWKVINMHKPKWPAREADYDLEALTKQAVHLSGGELIDITLTGFGSDDLLDHILLRSSKLNSLSLTDCCNLTTSRLNDALKMVPQLEKLHIYHTGWLEPLEEYFDVRVLNCPQIKSFKLDIERIYEGCKCDYDAFDIAHNMPELRHLQLFGNEITNTGLKAILYGCPHLESLDLRTCYNIDIHGNEVKLCMERIKNFKGPNESIENCGFHPLILPIPFDDPDEDHNDEEDEDPNDTQAYHYNGNHPIYVGDPDMEFYMDYYGLDYDEV